MQMPKAGTAWRAGVGMLINRRPYASPDKARWLRWQRVTIMLDSIREPPALGELNMASGSQRAIFISHAADDARFVKKFVQELLIDGCGLPKSEIFFSSRIDMGINSGDDLAHAVREAVHDAKLVIALISPTYQTRPFCIAELGAAWATIGNLFPLLTPGMSRTALDGVLQGMTIRSVDDTSALDEMHVRVMDATVRKSDVAGWNYAKAEWLQSVERYSAWLPTPQLATIVELNEALALRDAALSRVEELKQLVDDLQDRVERLAEATTREEVAEALLPSEESQQFEFLVEAVQSQTHGLPEFVVESIRMAVLGMDVPWPNRMEDPDSDLDARNALDRGYIRESDGFISPNADLGEVRQAMSAVEDLKHFLDYASNDFTRWFEATHGDRPNMSARITWEKMIG